MPLRSENTSFQPRTEPIFQLANPHTVVGYEWFSGPVGVGNVSDFFATHKQADLLDGQLLCRAYAETAELREGGFVTVNVSVSSLHSDRFWEIVAGCANRMVLEISERGALERSTHLISHLEAWRQSGGMVAFDDYGAGAARVLELGWVRPEIVKLDLEFTRHLIRRESAYAEAVCGLLVNTAEHVIAEGVGDVEDAEALAMLGVSLGQGREFFARVPVG